MMIYCLIFFAPGVPIWIIVELLSFFSKDKEYKMDSFIERVIVFYLWPFVGYFLCHKLFMAKEVK
jgi:hypothetical protein